MEVGISGSRFDSSFESGVLTQVLGVIGSSGEVGSCLVESWANNLLLESLGKDGKLPSCCCCVRFRLSSVRGLRKTGPLPLRSRLGITFMLDLKSCLFTQDVYAQEL